MKLKESGQLDHHHRPECPGNQDTTVPQAKDNSDDFYSDLYQCENTPRKDDYLTAPPNVALSPACDSVQPVARAQAVGARQGLPRTYAASGRRNRETEETLINIFGNCEHIYYLYPDTRNDE
ncbi:hypothetical protein BGZ72_007217 [Mortierella alpina]|nr:hypothetical protein BGZ72_007217 [Mortierella alpina]